MRYQGIYGTGGYTGIWNKLRLHIEQRRYMEQDGIVEQGRHGTRWDSKTRELWINMEQDEIIETGG